MANEQPQQQQDPTKKKGFIFAIFPFFPWAVIVLIALHQNKAFEKISSLQNASASSNTREELKACFKQLNIPARGVDKLSDKDANDQLFDCKEALKRAS